jgi:hypothetical protein
MTPDKAAESALMTKRQLTRERPRPSSPPSPRPSSGTTRESTPSESRTVHGEVGSSRNESSSSSSESSYSPQSEGAMKPLDKPSVGKKTPGTAGGLRFTRNKHATPAYTSADTSWVRASSSPEHEAEVARHTSTAVEETSKKLDSPNIRANIKRWAREAAA